MRGSRSMLCFLGGAVTAGAGAALTYRLLTERWELSVTRATFGVKGLPPDLEGVTVAHLSDFHVGPQTPVEFVEEAVCHANALKPDAVMLTGDYVDDEDADLEGCGRALAGLTAPLGVYGVLGNHDYVAGADAVAGALAAGGIKVLRNQAVGLGEGLVRLWVVGLDDTASHREEFRESLSSVPAGAPTIVLSHSPDVLNRSAEARVGLVLAGHTHGGQVRLPGLGAPHAPTRLTPQYAVGSARIGNARLYVSRGVGMTMFPVRFNCPPEIGLFTLIGTLR